MIKHKKQPIYQYSSCEKQKKCATIEKEVHVLNCYE